MNKIYLQLEFGSGKFYSYSKEEMEGYSKHTSSKGNVSYRRYYDRVEGELDSVSVVKTKFGEVLDFTFIYEDTIIHCPYQLYDQRGHISLFGEAAIKYLSNLEIGKYYVMTPYNFKPEDSNYSKIGISFKLHGERVEQALTNSYYKDGKLVKGDIPAIEWVEKRGKNMPDMASLEKKTDFLYDIIQKNIDRLKSTSTYESRISIPGKFTSTTKPVEKKEEIKTKEPEVAMEDDDDELPF
jgi:hypothetical protein